MRALVLLCAVAAGCGGRPTSSDPGATAPRAAPRPAPATPVRVELGRCTTARVPFASGLRPRTPAIFAAGAGGLGLRGSPAPVQAGDPSASGALDKNIIRRYIRRQLAPIRLCYERQLLVDPDLAGKVTARFAIQPDGSVSGVSAAGLHPKVDSCVASVIAKIQFPKPRGGGYVNVTYPFVFRSASASASKPASQPTPAEAKKQAIDQARRAGLLGAIGGVVTLETPLGPAREEIERCARKYLVGSDALIVDLRGDESPRARSSSSNRPLEQCVAAAAAAIKGAERRCPIAIGEAEASSLPRIILDRGALRFDGESIGPLDGGGESALAEKLSTYRGRVIAPGFTPPVARLGPVVLQVSGETQVRAVRAVRALAERADLYAALAVAGGSSPRLLRSDPLPWVPVPTSMLATAAGARVQISIGQEVTFETAGSQPVVIELSRARDQIRQALTGLHKETPIAIGASPDRRFADVVTVIDAVSAAGYHNWDLD